MATTYGDIFARIIFHMAKFESRDAIFRRLGIPRHQFHNVTNPNRRTSGGNRYHMPMEWAETVTRVSGDTKLIDMMATRCGGLFVPSRDIEALKKHDSRAVLIAIARMTDKLISLN